MTEPRITTAWVQEQLALAEKATSGPWVSGITQFDGKQGHWVGLRTPRHVTISEPSRIQEADNDLIAAARTGYPAALRALAEHQRVLRALVDDHDIQGAVMRSSEAQYKLREARALLGEAVKDAR